MSSLHLYWPVHSSMQEDIDPASTVSVPIYELNSENTVVYTKNIYPSFKWCIV